MAAPRDRVLNALSGICRVLFCVCGPSLNSSRGELMVPKFFTSGCVLYFIFYILYLISCILYLISFILYLISCILYLVSCILYLVSYIFYLVSCILYLIFCLSIRSPCSYGRKTLLLHLEDHGLLFSSFWQCKGTKNIDTLQIVFELFLHYCYFFQLYLGKGTQ